MTRYKPVTHVIFDMDGTLLTSDDLIMNVFESFVIKYGKSLTISQKLQLKEESSKESLSFFIKELNLPISIDDFINSLVEEFRKPVSDNCKLKPGVERLVKHLYNNNIPIAIASNSTNRIYEMEKKYLKVLEGCFHHVVTANSEPEIKKEKPAPDAFLFCARRFDENPDPEKVLVIEDSVTGIKAAMAAGMQVVVVPDPLMDKELCKDATLILDTLESFQPELFSLPPFPSE